MATIMLASVVGSPGVTTTALALALTWDRPVILIEADTNRYSSIMPGYLRGQIPHVRGMTELAVDAHARGTLTMHQLYGQTIPLVDPPEGEEAKKLLLPGFSDLAGTKSWDGLWNSLGSAAAAFDQAGIDVIIDAGLLKLGDPRRTLFPQMDAMTLLVKPDLPSLVATNSRLPELLEDIHFGGPLSDPLTILHAATPHRNGVSTKETSKVLRMPVLGSITWDPRAAAIFSDGETELQPFRKTKLSRSTQALRSSLRSRLEAWQKLVGSAQTSEDASHDSEVRS